MNLRRQGIGAIDRALSEAQKGLEQAEHEREQHRKLVGLAAAEKRELADDPAARQEAADREQRHASEVERLSDVIELRKSDLEDLRYRRAHANFDEAYAGVVSAAARRREASEKLANVLAPAVRAMTTRDAAHDELEAAIAHARSLVPADVEFELPESIDEAEFPAGVDQLAKALREGPRRPLARTAAAIEKQRREFERAESSRLASLFGRYYEQGDGLSDIKRLPPEHLAKAAGYFERRLSRERATSSEVFVEKTERRLERLRALASEVSTAA